MRLRVYDSFGRRILVQIGMLEASSDFPDDVAELQAIIASQNEKLSIFETEIKERDYRIEKLEHQLAGLRRHQFGARSEALDQLELTLEDEEIARAVETPVGEDGSDTSSDTPKGKPKRKPLPDHLPRNDEILSPGTECSACGGSLTRFIHRRQLCGLAGVA